MPHDTPLIATIVAGLCLAFILAAVAQRLPQAPPLVGYLVAGVAGRARHARLRRRPEPCARTGRDRRHPADVRRRPAFLAEGSSLGPRHRGAGRGGADRVATAWRGWLALLGWSPGAGWSSVSRFRWPVDGGAAARHAGAAADRDRAGRIAVGLADRRRPRHGVGAGAAAGAVGGVLGGQPGRPAGATGLAVPACWAFSPLTAYAREGCRSSSCVMVVVGRRVIPWVLHYVAHTGSRELFRLACPRHRAGRRLRRRKIVRRVAGARRVLRRHDHGENWSSAIAQRRIPAASRCFFGAVLRLGRHAVSIAETLITYPCR